MYYSNDPSLEESVHPEEQEDEAIDWMYITPDVMDRRDWTPDSLPPVPAPPASLAETPPSAPQATATPSYPDATPAYPEPSVEAGPMVWFAAAVVGVAVLLLGATIFVGSVALMALMAT